LSSERAKGGKMLRICDAVLARKVPIGNESERWLFLLFLEQRRGGGGVGRFYRGVKIEREEK